MKPQLIFLLLLPLLVYSCQKESSPKHELKPVALTPIEKSLISGSNQFGFDFFARAVQFAPTDRNFMFSPLSISMALGMTRNGAADSTLIAMNQVLGFDNLDETSINQGYRSLISTLTTLDPQVKMLIANSIWYRNTFAVLAPFIETNQQYFGAQVQALDFNSPEAPNTINHWVSDHTNELIHQIVEQVDPDNVMFLINAVYFKGQWQTAFDATKTKDSPFTAATGETVQAPAMFTRAHFEYYADGQLQAIQLPYNQGNFMMTLVLPAQGTGLGEVAQTMTQFATWNFTERDIQLQLPRFKFSYDEGKMLEILRLMGMGIAFDEGLANFSRINAAQQLYISDIKHKTYIETNEQGTEAAGVTSVGISTTSVGIDDPINLILDRPFVFLITEKSSGTVLFAGAVNNPLSN